jgi:hypothetical protein
VFSFFNVIDLGRPFVEHPLQRCDSFCVDQLLPASVCVLFGVVSVLVKFLICSTARFVSGALVLFVRPAPFSASRSTRSRVLQSSILNFLSVRRLPACPCRLVLRFSVYSGAIKFRFDLFISSARIGFSYCVRARYQGRVFLLHAGFVSIFVVAPCVPVAAAPGRYSPAHGHECRTCHFIFIMLSLACVECWSSIRWDVSWPWWGSMLWFEQGWNGGDGGNLSGDVDSHARIC